MSQLIFEFDPSVATTGQIPIAQSAAQGSLHFWNESNIGLQIKFQDGIVLYLPAWYHRHVSDKGGQQQATYSYKNTPQSGGAPLSIVYVEAFGSGEIVPPDGPLIGRTNNQGNSATVPGSVTAIVNDGNAVNTSIVEATVAGDVSSAVKWTNDAKLINGNAAHPGVVQFDNNLIASDGLGHWFAQTFRLPIGGMAQVATRKLITLSTGKTTLTHGCTTVPDIILPIVRWKGSTPTAIVAYDPATINNSTVDLYANTTVDIDFFAFVI